VGDGGDGAADVGSLTGKEIVKSAMINVDCVVKGAIMQTPEGIILKVTNQPQ
jgi:hypothetical protein